MADNDMLMVLAASYDTVSDAEVDYEAIKALYHEVAASHDFDAAVLERDESGKVRVVKKHEQPTGTARRKAWGWDLRSAPLPPSSPGSRWQAASWREAPPAPRSGP